jgi:hypothetical protein
MAAPPIAPDVDLRGFPWTPIHRARLFASTFHARADDAEWRAGVTLFLKSWDQTPAGSLPDDDVELCRLAELARDIRRWRKVKPMALLHWEKADDGRLYHRVVTEFVTNAWDSKVAQRKRTEAATAARRKPTVTENVTVNVTSTNREKKVRKKESKPTSESVAARDADADFSENLNGMTPVGRFAPLASASPPPIGSKRKELLRQKLMRFAHSRLPDAKRSAAIFGLSGADPEHDDQWWLDTLDRQMRRSRWNDSEAVTA